MKLEILKNEKKIVFQLGWNGLTVTQHYLPVHFGYIHCNRQYIYVPTLYHSHSGHTTDPCHFVTHN